MAFMCSRSRRPNISFEADGYAAAQLQRQARQTWTVLNSKGGGGAFSLGV
jgi:hypothetical protein